MGPKKVWVQKSFGSKKVLGPKKFWVQKILGPKKLWVQKNFASKKILGPKKFESENYFESNIFAAPPSYGIGLSMVCWISRGGRMGVPFLGFRVAYIPNLSLLQSLEPFEKESKI